ncbi:MAG: ATP-binding protein [Bacteroidales bacterium]|nr:ATP-binding protein [Bacteroidales bacterium]
MAYSLLRSLLRRPVVGGIIIVAGSVGATWSVMHGETAWGVASGIVAIYGLWKVCSIERRMTGKLNLMIEAIGNNDYTMRFGGRWAMGDERAFNAALGRLSDIMRKEKMAVAQQENYHTMVLDVIRTGIVAVSTDGFVRQVNAEALKTLGLVVLTHVHQLDNLLPGMDDQLRQMADGESRHVSFNRHGQEAQLLIRASSAMLDGKRVRVFAIDDIRSSLDAQEIDSWIRLTRVLTHEIMNSMAPMVSLSRVMLGTCEDGDATDEKVRDGLRVICDTSEGLVRFVESFRRFTSLPTPVPRLVCVAELVDEVGRLFEAEPDGTRFFAEIKPDDLMVYADPSLVRQVVVNIVKNARQAMAQSGEGSEIRVKGFSDGDIATIEISNDGPAIPDDVAEQIFIPFFTTKPDGSGIGLSVSRQIMRLSHGNLTLRRDTVGRFKTTFVLTFE